jgi:hypothetical protein
MMEEMHSSRDPLLASVFVPGSYDILETVANCFGAAPGDDDVPIICGIRLANHVVLSERGAKVLAHLFRPEVIEVFGRDLAHFVLASILDESDDGSLAHNALLVADPICSALHGDYVDEPMRAELISAGGRAIEIFFRGQIVALPLCLLRIVELAVYLARADLSIRAFLLEFGLYPMLLDLLPLSIPSWSVVLCHREFAIPDQFVWEFLIDIFDIIAITADSRRSFVGTIARRYPDLLGMFFAAYGEMVFCQLDPNPNEIAYIRCLCRIMRGSQTLVRVALDYIPMGIVLQTLESNDDTIQSMGYHFIKRLLIASCVSDRDFARAVMDFVFPIIVQGLEMALSMEVLTTRVRRTIRKVGSVILAFDGEFSSQIEIVTGLTDRLEEDDWSESGSSDD